MMKGFTLIEILIVVILLGILAAAVVPQFSGASDTAKANILAGTLRVVRTQISLFYGEHSIAPGYPGLAGDSAPTAEVFVSQMTQATNDAGETAPEGTAGFEHGPYIRRIPANPVSTRDTVRVLGNDDDFPAEADGATGWIYKPATLRFKANCTGQDEYEIMFIDY